MAEAPRKRGGERSVETSVGEADRARLAKAGDEWYGRVKDGTSVLLGAVKDDLVSRAVDAHKKGGDAEKPLTKDDVGRIRSTISSEKVEETAKDLLLHALMQEQHNAQLRKGSASKRYEPDLSTLTDTVRDLTPQSAKKFVKSKSIPFLLEHHQQIIAQRIREMAGKDALLKPVEFVAETSDPAHYIGRLFYKGSYSKVSILEENCVGTIDDYFDQSKINPETGRPETEVFVVMKRWEQTTMTERKAAVARLLPDEKTMATIQDEAMQILRRRGVHDPYQIKRRLYEQVGRPDDTLDIDSPDRKRISANEIFLQAASYVLNRERSLLTHSTIFLSYERDYLVETLCKLPHFTDIPVITVEYDVAKGAIEQARARVDGEPDQPLAAGDPRKQILLDTLWGIARSERYNQRTGKWERRRILQHQGLDGILAIDGREGLRGGILLKEAGGRIGLVRTIRVFGEELLGELLQLEFRTQDYELLGGTFRVDDDTPDELLEALPNLSVNVSAHPSAGQDKLDKITRVNGMLRIWGSRKGNRINLKNITYAGAVDVRDTKIFRANKLEEVEAHIYSGAAEHYLGSLRMAPDITLEPPETWNRLVFVAPKLESGDIVLIREKEFAKYDCPVPFRVHKDDGLGET